MPLVSHLSRDTGVKIPLPNFATHSHWTDHWSLPLVFWRLPGSRNGFASFQCGTPHQRGTRRVAAGLVHQLVNACAAAMP